MASASAGRRLRRTWPQRLLIAFNVFLIFACLVTAGGLGYFYLKFGELPRIELGTSLDEAEAPGEPQNFLLVGSDSAEGLAEDDFILSGREDVTGERTDTMMVLRVDPRTEQAWLLSIPRDLWVPIADDQGKARINNAFNEGGPERLIKTIQANLNIEIHHYVQVNFAGFKKLVDAVDGVPVYFPSAARDMNSGLRVDQPGCITLDGSQALAYARSRHYQYMENGRWRTDPTGDINRMARQQNFIRRALKRSIAKGVRNPVKLNELLNVATDSVKVDSELSNNDIFRLGRRFRAVEPDTVVTLTLPTRVGNVGGASVLFLEENADEVLQVFRDGTSPGGESMLPQEVRVRVLNGTGVAQQAGKVSEALGQAGFNNAGAGDAERSDFERTTIRYPAGKEAQADLLRRHLQSGAVLEQVEAVNNADVVLVTGRDFTAVTEAAAPPDAATPTTAAPATTTTTTAATTVPGIAAGDPAEQQCG